MKYLIYARVSPRGGDYSEKETSIPMQIDICKEYVKARGGEVVRVLSDEFYSGKDTNRPGFMEVLADLETGRANWDVLLVYKLSRMSRSKRDAEDIFCKLSEWGKGFACATEQWDFSTPVGRAMMSIMQAFNQLEREQCGENTRNKLLSIASKGLWPVGKPPFGYCRGKSGDNKLYVDPRKAQIVRDLFHSYGNLDTFTRELISRYRGVLSKSKIFKVLRDRTYLGKIVYAGNEYDGQHETLVDFDVFSRVQELLPQKKYNVRPKAQKYPFLLAGILFCSCGRRLTPATAKSGDYAYYQCTDSCCGKRVSAPKLEMAVKEYISRLHISSDVLQETKQFHDAKNEEKISEVELELRNIAVARRSAEEEKGNILRILLNGALNGSVTAIVNEKAATIDTELERLAAREYMLRDMIEKMSCSWDEVLDMVNGLRKFAQIIDDPNLDFADARKIVLMYIDKIEMLGDGQFVFCPTLPADSSTNGMEWGG